MPTRPIAALFTSLPLDPRSSAPLYRQLYDGVRHAILQGHLRAGTRLPSTRALADGLNLSRNTIALAYEQLLAEGYVEGRAGSGTYVSRALPEQLLHASSATSSPAQRPGTPAVLARRGEALTSGPQSLARYPHGVRAFYRGAAVDAFPFGIWTRLVLRRLRARPSHLLGSSDRGGHRPLREAIARYLGTSRAVQCCPEQVIVCSGSLRALDFSMRLLLDEGEAVWLEDPCYHSARSIIKGAGARLIPVPVDEEGLDVADGVARCPGGRMAYVTPSHQYPLGMTMSLARRLALLDWASRSGAWILEDDYDSEYRYEGRPLASLQGLDRDGQVLYLGNFSRVLFPALRLSYLVVPPALVDAFVTAQAVLGGPPPLLDQIVVADFITEGHFVRHLRRMRTLYAERQAILVKAAARELGGLLEVRPAEAGMYLIGWLPPGVDDQAASRVAAEHGIAVDPLSPLSLKPVPRGGLLLGYAALNARQIREGVRKLAEALRRLPAARK